MLFQRSQPKIIGLFDNLFKDEIKSTIREIVKDAVCFNSRVAQKMAEELAVRAYKKSKMELTKTPFQIKYQKELHSTWVSGKEDDITVVVGIVKPLINY